MKLNTNFLRAVLPFGMMVLSGVFFATFGMMIADRESIDDGAIFVAWIAMILYWGVSLVLVRLLARIPEDQQSITTPFESIMYGICVIASVWYVISFVGVLFG